MNKTLQSVIPEQMNQEKTLVSQNDVRDPDGSKGGRPIEEKGVEQELSSIDFSIIEEINALSLQVNEKVQWLKSNCEELCVYFGRSDVNITLLDGSKKQFILKKKREILETCREIHLKFSELRSAISRAMMEVNGFTLSKPSSFMLSSSKRWGESIRDIQRLEESQRKEFMSLMKSMSTIFSIFDLQYPNECESEREEIDDYIHNENNEAETCNDQDGCCWKQEDFETANEIIDACQVVKEPENTSPQQGIHSHPISTPSIPHLFSVERLRKTIEHIYMLMKMVSIGYCVASPFGMYATGSLVLMVENGVRQYSPNKRIEEKQVEKPH